MQSKIILLVGFQASTKSTAAQEILSNVPNAVILSRDTEGGTVEALVAKAENHIKDGKVVVNKDGTNKQTCKTIKVHKKLEGTEVPVKK